MISEGRCDDTIVYASQGEVLRGKDILCLHCGAHMLQTPQSRSGPRLLQGFRTSGGCSGPLGWRRISIVIHIDDLRSPRHGDKRMVGGRKIRDCIAYIN